MPNDYIYVYGTTGHEADKLRTIVNTGLLVAKDYLGIAKPTTVRIWIRKRGDKFPKNFVSDGEGRGKRAIYITISRKYLKSRTLRQLAGTVIHEYIHVLRYNLRDSKTVLAASIEEGISCYVQTKLWKAPNYLDIKTLDEKMVRICWQKLEAALQKNTKKYPIIWKKESYREMLYRLGFGIIRQYVRKNPKLTFYDLVLTKQKRLIKFAKETYGK